MHPTRFQLGLNGLALATCLLAATAFAQAEQSLALQIVDDAAAKFIGTWKTSKSVAGYYGEGYQHASGPEVHEAAFVFNLLEAGEYHLLVSYTSGGNRAKNAQVKFKTATKEQSLRIDQQVAPQGPLGFHDLGKFSLAAGEQAIVLTTADTQGVVIADAVALLTPAQYKSAQKQMAEKKAIAKKEEPPREPTPVFTRVAPKQPLSKLTTEKLDAMLAKELPELTTTSIIDDQQFLRRISLDLIGRNPTREELLTFVKDASPNKRRELIDRWLDSPEFGENWANYWSDVVSYRVPEPELTFLNYKPFKAWLAQSINRGRGWDDVTFTILTAQGKVGDHPEATFLGFHQADKSRLAAETTRIFLGTQIQCAECHDHKFIDLPQKTFHQFAAFFVRSQAKVAQNDSSGIEVLGKPAGEHVVPGNKEQLAPTAFEMAKVELGASDMSRRTALAQWMVAPENPFLAKAFVNRVWARTMGRGFCEPVDEIGELGDQILPEVHAALAEHFVASGFDVKDVYRVVVNTKAYQRELLGDVKDPGEELPRLSTSRLRGDEVFQSLVTAVGLPNITPPQMKATGAVRFPPPPKSTRDLVSDAFGFDPSIAMENVTKTMNQAMFMMNNEQIQKQIDARPESETRLANILATEKDDVSAIKALFENVLVRQPTSSEVDIAVKHLAEVKDRQSGFEDLLWSLLNSAEFTTRR